MTNPADLPASIVPAQLGFLAIYNPSLGTTDETLDDQIVYYISRESRKRPRSSSKKEDVSQEQLNERLRQIGLAQGMVDFGKNFSDGRSVDAIETEKSRIILLELEVGWWILAVREAVQRDLVIFSANLLKSTVDRLDSFALCFPHNQRHLCK